MATETTAKAHVRRPQAERSASTRAKLIEAAIGCLHRLGYGATSTSQVAAEAGVSRGAMLHHFPTKTDLMLALVRSVFETDSVQYQHIADALSPQEWLRTMSDTVWKMASKPSGIAVMEIMLASRSDPELADKLRALQQKINREAHAWVMERHAAAGLEAHRDSEAIHRLFLAAARGLALEELFMHNRGEIKKSVDVLSDTLRHFYPDLDKS